MERCAVKGSLSRPLLGLVLVLLAATSGRGAPLQPDDTKYFLEWYARLPESPSALGVLNLPEAWGISQGSPSVTIAILDTGVISTAPDLTGRVLPPLSANPSYPSGFGDVTLAGTTVLRHGTWVASVAAMEVDNGMGGAGIGDFSVLPITVTGPTGANSGLWIADAIYMAADAGARVISISQGTSLYSELDTAAAYARTKGALTIVAAGNDNARKDMPAYANLIFVSGTREDDTRWGTVAGEDGGSTWGPFVDISAPAHNILAEDPTLSTGYGVGSGTSFAAPMVAGAAALAWSINPDLTPQEVEQMLYSTAKDLGTPRWDEVYGWGRLDVGALAAAAYASITPEPATLGLLGLGLAGLLARRRAG